MCQYYEICYYIFLCLELLNSMMPIIGLHNRMCFQHCPHGLRSGLDLEHMNVMLIAHYFPATSVFNKFHTVIVHLTASASLMPYLFYQYFNLLYACFNFTSWVGDTNFQTTTSIETESHQVICVNPFYKNYIYCKCIYY